MDVQSFNELIHRRRSVFQKEYSGERVDDAIIEAMLENANWAPTHKFTEPWRFLVYTGEGLKELARIQGQCYQEVTTKDGTFKEDRYQNLLKKPLLSSHVIVVWMKRDDAKRVPEVEELGAVFCAIQNMYLTATAYGVGCYLSTGGITYFEEAGKYFGLGQDDKLIGFLNIGVPKEIKTIGKRMPIEEKVIWKR